MTMTDWIEHRRPDGEIVGWMRPVDDRFEVIDLLGRPVGEPTDWLSGEERLEEAGIGYLADPWSLTLEPGRAIRVRIAEVSPSGIRVKLDDFGDRTAPQLYYDLEFPAPVSLVEWGGSDR